MTTQLYLGLVLTFLVPIFVGCSDPPSPTGGGLLGGEFEIRQIIIPADDLTLSAGIAAVPNASSQGNDVMLVGIDDEATRADALLAITDTSLPLFDLSSDDIVAARLRLFPVGYRFGGDETMPTSFEIVSFDGSFGESTQWETDVANRVNAGVVLGSFSATIPDSTTLLIDLDHTAIAAFLSSYYDIVEVDGRIEVNTRRSIALRSGPQSGAIRSFLGSTVRSVDDGFLPALEITLADTTVVLEFGVSTWIADVPAAGQLGDDRLDLSAAGPIRSHLQFPLDSIPENALIQKADLRLFIDPASERFGTAGVITTVLGIVAGDNPTGPEDAYDTRPPTGLRFVVGVRPAEDDESFAAEIRFPNLSGVLSQWLRYRSSSGSAGIANNGLTLALPRANPAIEGASIDRLSFYTSGATTAPRLEIVVAVPRGSE